MRRISRSVVLVAALVIGVLTFTASAHAVIDSVGAVSVPAGQTASSTVRGTSEVLGCLTVTAPRPLEVTVEPSGCSVNGTWSATVTVRAPAETRPGTYTITVTETPIYGSDASSRSFTARVTPPPPPTTTTPPPTVPAETTLPPTTEVPTTLAPPDTAPPTTAPPAEPELAAAPTTAVPAPKPVPVFAAVASVPPAPASGNVVFLPLTGFGWNGCFATLQTEPCRPGTRIALLNAASYDVAWRSPGDKAADLERLAVLGADRLTPVGVAPADGADATYALPVLDLGGPDITTRALYRDLDRSTTFVPASGSNKTVHLPVPEGPEVQGLAQATRTEPPFGTPEVLPAASFTERIPVLVTSGGDSGALLYGVRFPSSDGKGFVPLLASTGLASFARTADGRVGLAIPVAEGFVLEDPAEVAGASVTDVGETDSSPMKTAVLFGIFVIVITSAVGVYRWRMYR